MAVVDYESAWGELTALIVSREGWGSKTLAAEAVTIAAKHRIPEDLVARILRIYGPDAIREVTNAGNRPNATAGTPPSGSSERPPTTEALGGHDDDQQHQHDHQHAVG